MRLALLILLMPLVVLFTGVMWFASLWSAHQEDHKATGEYSHEP